MLVYSTVPVVTTMQIYIALIIITSCKYLHKQNYRLSAGQFFLTMKIYL